MAGRAAGACLALACALAAQAAGAGESGSRLAAEARALVGRSSLREVTAAVPDDCSGLVRHLYARAGIDVGFTPGPGGAAAAIERHARRAGALSRRARPGDLVFFRDTLAHRDAGITHVGVVSRVEAGGTVAFVHRAGAGIVESRVTPRSPRALRAADGRALNDRLRRASGGRPGATTGQLFAGYASRERLARRPAARRRPRR